MHLFMTASTEGDNVTFLVTPALGSFNETMGVRLDPVVATKLAGLLPHPLIKFAGASAFSSLSGLKKGLVVLDAIALCFVKTWTSLHGTHSLRPSITVLDPTFSTSFRAVSPIAGQLAAVDTAVMLSNGSRFSMALSTSCTALRATVTKVATIGAGFGQAISHGLQVLLRRDYTMPIAKGLLLRPVR